MVEAGGVAVDRSQDVVLPVVATEPDERIVHQRLGRAQIADPTQLPGRRLRVRGEQVGVVRPPGTDAERVMPGRDDRVVNRRVNLEAQPLGRGEGGAGIHANEDRAALHSLFHTALVSATGSPLLLAMRQKLFDRALRYRRMVAQFRAHWRPRAAAHKAIRDAVLDRSPEAPDLIERHIRETTDNGLTYATHLFPADSGAQAA